MILIIGGAYQGKLDFAKETFGITDSDVHICDAGEIDFSKRCIYKIEEFTYNHPDPIGYFQTHRDEWKDSTMRRNEDETSILYFACPLPFGNTPGQRIFSGRRFHPGSL